VKLPLSYDPKTGFILDPKGLLVADIRKPGYRPEVEALYAREIVAACNSHGTATKVIEVARDLVAMWIKYMDDEGSMHPQDHGINKHMDRLEEALDAIPEGGTP
jgi:hypothetical protein